MIELSLLGTTDLRRDGREMRSFLAGPKRLGLLAYLVLARPRGYQRRDKVLALFWPEHGQRAARNALSNMLYHVRQALGEGQIVNRGHEELRVREEGLRTDVLAFEAALDAGEVQEALGLYRGDLLEGFHVPDAAPAFAHWLDQERERLRLRASGGAWKLATEAERDGDAGAARRWAKRATALVPFSDEAQVRLVALLDRTGDRTGALDAYATFAARMQREWGLAPSAELRTLAEQVRTRSAPVREKTTPVPARPAPPVDERSLAVLPFEALGERAASGFAYGIHGDLLTRLSAVSDLRVISRTSVRSYHGTTKTIADIGAELNAAWVVEGEVQEASNAVQVNVRLIDAREDRQVWAHDYRQALTARSLFQIQGEITKTIAGALQARLTPEEARRIEQRPTEDLGAYRLYTQGRVHLDRRTEDGMRRALRLFRRALERDERYALAWVGLADAYALLHDYGYAEAGAVLPQAREAVQRALEIDPELAEAHASRGLLHSILHEGPSAMEALAQAVSLKPSYAEAHNWLSWVSVLLGRGEEGLASARQAVELNPLSPEAVSNLSLSHLVTGRLDQALAEARREHELGSSWGTGRFYEGLTLYEMGRFDAARAVLDGLEAPWAGAGPRASHALACIASGRRDEARAIRDRLRKTERAFAEGLVDLALGETEAARAAFDRVGAWGHWPTIAVRHLYREVWRALPSPSYRMLLGRVDRSWGLSAPVHPTDALDPHVVAILPFEDRSRPNEDRSFAAGLHDDLLTKLSRVGTLTVIARASVTRYRKAAVPVAEAARRLGAGTVVEGTVRRAGDRIRLNVQLVDVRTEELRWAETYDRQLAPSILFDTQDELAERIARSLEATLSPAERRRVRHRPTDNLEAYRLCAQGRLALDRRTEDSIRHAHRLFRESIEQDSEYALAWAGLADALSLLRFYQLPTPRDASDAGKAARRAVALAPDLGEAHTALGIHHAVCGEGRPALRSLARAAEAAPSYAEAWIWLSWTHLCMGNPGPALDHGRRAVRLNPLAPAVRSYFAQALLADGDAASALQEARRAREIEPDYGLAHFVEGLVLHHEGRFTAATSALQRALALVPARGTPSHDEIHALLAVTYAATGDRVGARELADRIDARMAPFANGLALVALGDAEAAFGAFERVATWSSFSTEICRYFFPEVLGPLRSDTRYAALLRAVDRSWGIQMGADSSS